MSAHEFLDVDQAAEYLKVSASNLNKRRVAGTGPRYSKLGRRVIYRRTDLDAWISANMRGSTSDIGGAIGA
jgi:predicted DNA-binding transcriptional regulator AlpA